MHLSPTLTKNEPPTRLILMEFAMSSFVHLSPEAEILLVQRVTNVSSEAASLIMVIMPLVTGISQKRLRSPSLARSTCHPYPTKKGIQQVYLHTVLAMLPSIIHSFHWLVSPASCESMPCLVVLERLWLSKTSR